MSTMSPVPKDHPLMLAWEVHKKTEEYANSRNWAANPRHVDGSLWALFSAGWQAAQPRAVPDGCATEEVVTWLREQAHELHTDNFDAIGPRVRHRLGYALSDLADYLAAAPSPGESE